jgi:hypothetical protein
LLVGLAGGVAGQIHRVGGGEVAIALAPS